MTDARGGARVLLVEDDVLLAVDLEDELRSAGWAVVGPAGWVGHALRLAAGEALDAALLNIALADGGSFAVADALAARGVPLVCMTGYSGELPPGPLASAPRLVKPHRPGSVLAALAAAVEGRPFRDE